MDQSRCGDLRMPDADQLLREMAQAPLTPAPAKANPTMGNLQKIRYTHDAMIDLIIARPAISQTELAAMFDYTPAWVSNMLASDVFKARLEERRKECIDPFVMATVKERVEGLVLRSLEVLQNKLAQPVVSDQVALKALELGTKAMGLGGNAPPAPPPLPEDRLLRLAERLTNLRGGQGATIVQGEVLERKVSNG